MGISLKTKQAVRRTTLTGTLAGSLLGALALVTVTPAYAELTPFGAEKAGNASGTIPAWAPQTKSTSDGTRLVNPFAAEQPKFRIDASNVDQHAANLSAGQIAMIRRHEGYYLPVYESHRGYTNPDVTLNAISSEAAGIKLVSGGVGITGLKLSSVPFPTPETGVEVIWNHIARYRSAGYTRNYAQAPVQSNGAYTLQRLQDKIMTRVGLASVPKHENYMTMLMQRILEPARLEGNVLLVHETIDQSIDPRAAWVYNAGQRRVRRAPNTAYDGPGTASEGMRTTDDFDMFNGSPDKYDWVLKGKQEMYVPANSYQLASPDLKYKDVIGKNHLNQQHTRYELRRVWVVEGTLKSGERHIYGKRNYYFDEDSWSARIGDVYDNRGELWRFMEAHQAFETSQKFTVATGLSIHDLQADRYIVLNLISEENPQFQFDAGLSVRDFTPSALRRAGRK